MTNEAKAETAKLLFRSPEGEHPLIELFLLERGGLGISVGGYALVMPIERWHELACKGFGREFPPAPAQ